MSILECILIDASRDGIRLTANDMELGIETIIEGDVIEKGVIAIDAKIFLEIVRKLPDNDITIETDSSVKKPSLTSAANPERIFPIFPALKGRKELF